MPEVRKDEQKRLVAEGRIEEAARLTGADDAEAQRTVDAFYKALSAAQNGNV